MTPEQRTHAGRTLAQVMHVHGGMTARELAQRGHVDVKTVRALLRGDRWPTTQSRDAIEAALNLPRGTIAQWAGGSPDRQALLRSLTDQEILGELARRLGARREVGSD